MLTLGIILMWGDAFFYDFGQSVVINIVRISCTLYLSDLEN